MFSCVWMVWGIVCSEKHLQTIIGKCVKPAINLLYWRGSLSGSLNRIDFSPCEQATEKAEPPKRTSQTEAGTSRKGKWQGENRGVETEPEVLRQSRGWKQKLLEVFKRKADYHRSSSKKRNFQGLRQRWVVRRDEKICVSKELHLGGMVPCLLSCLVFTKASSPHYNIAFSSAMEKFKVSWLGLWHLDKW